jgi:hypothetical protein
LLAKRVGDGAIFRLPQLVLAGPSFAESRSRLQQLSGAQEAANLVCPVIHIPSIL